MLFTLSHCGGVSSVTEVAEVYDVAVFAPSACELECKPSTSLRLYRHSLTSSELCAN